MSTIIKGGEIRVFARKYSKLPRKSRYEPNGTRQSGRRRSVVDLQAGKGAVSPHLCPGRRDCRRPGCIFGRAGARGRRRSGRDIRKERDSTTV